MFLKKISRWSVVVPLLVLVGLSLAWGHTAVDARSPVILQFETMVGNTSAFTGATNPIRGINGGGLPWMVAGSAAGELRADGQLEVRVRGLVLAEGANTGSNPSATFRAIVSCLNGDGGIENVMTDPFPATTGPATAGGGNSRISAQVELPQPCIAPIVFVTSASGSWFAATGN